MRQLRGSIAFVTLAFVLALPSAATAITSLASPLRWWDLDNDGVRNEPVEGDRAFNVSGGGWNQARLDRAAAATAEWRGDTTWDVTRELPNVATPASIYVDRNPSCGSFGGAPAVACTAVTPRGTCCPAFSWNDISDSDIFMSPNVVWHTGAAQGAANVYDFQGILTHELGHGGGLVHPINVQACPQPWMTMCAPVQGVALNGFHARTLEVQDIADMNSQY